jgi:Protein of unknown function (DUF3300)
MNVSSKTLPALLLISLATLVIAQAPIVRQPASGPPPGYDQQPPDQQQSYPQAEPYPQAQRYPQSGSQGQLLPPDQLDPLVNRIALYPDPLLAQTLTAATYANELPDAAAWAHQHSYLRGDALSAAIQADNLPWDPSVLALLPFPSVLDMMARDPGWTAALGDAVLAQRADVMDAVQRLRRQAYSYGYLRSGANVDVIDQGGYIELEPFNPYLYYVPVYDPLIVFGPPRRGFVVDGAIRFGAPVTLGVTFGRFGWFGAGFGWGSHAVLIDHRPWERTYDNRGEYVHPYARPYARPTSPRVEEHHSAPPPRAAEQRDDGHRR